MQRKQDNWKYTSHHRDEAEGHIFLGYAKDEACTITLTGAASMSQEELDELGELIVSSVNSASKRNKKTC